VTHSGRSLSPAQEQTLISHELLGELKFDPNLKNTLTGSFKSGNSTIRLSIDLDGEEEETVVEFAAEIVARVEHFASRASNFAPSKLLDTYNENWLHYSTYGDNGEVVDVTDPELDSEGISQTLTLTSVTICGDTICEMFFSDGGMFAGHSVSVSSFDGTKFEKMDASLFG
jgi:hypothetical protein